MKQGRLGYNSSNDRYGLLASDLWIDTGFHCGEGLLIALYFVIKWAVKNGIKEAYSAITGKKTVEDIQNEKELKELGLDSEDQ